MEKLNRQGFIQIGERFTQRISSKVWKEVLIAREDKIIYAGTVRQLVAKPLGYGVVEVSMLPQQANGG